MATDLEQERIKFSKLPFEEKRKVVIELIKDIKDANPTLTDVYALITSSFAIESDFDELFDAVLRVKHQEFESEKQAALERIGTIKNRLQAMKLQEDQEKQDQQPELDSLLCGI